MQQVFKSAAAGIAAAAAPVRQPAPPVLFYPELQGPPLHSTHSHLCRACAILGLSRNSPAPQNGPVSIPASDHPENRTCSIRLSTKCQPYFQLYSAHFPRRKCALSFGEIFAQQPSVPTSYLCLIKGGIGQIWKNSSKAIQIGRILWYDG